MKNDEQLDELFHLHQNDWNDKPNANTWDQLNNRLNLHQNADKKIKSINAKWAIAATVLILLGFAFFAYQYKPNVDGQIAVNTIVGLPETNTAQPPTNEKQNKYLEKTVEEKTSVNNNINQAEMADAKMAQPITQSIKPVNTGPLALNVPTDQSENEVVEEIIIIEEESLETEMDDKENFPEQDLNQTDEGFSPSQYRSEAVVANAIGIETQKVAHESAAKKKQSKIAKEEFEESLSFSSKSSKVLKVQFPVNNKSNCSNVTFVVQQNFTQIYGCSEKHDFTQIENTKQLTKLFNLTFEELKAFENDNTDCKTIADITINWQHETHYLAAHEENFTWSSNCSEASYVGFVEYLKKLAENYID